MGMAMVSRLLEKKLRLYVRKVSLMGKVFAERPHYLLRYKDLNALMVVISREIAVNRKLLQYIKLYAESRRGHLEPVVVKFEGVTRELMQVLKQEKKVLNGIDIYNLVLHEASVVFFSRSRTRYFDLQFSRFQALHRREQELDAQLFAIVSQERRGLAIAKVKAYRRIAGDIQAQSRALLSSVGNSALVRKNAQELLRIISRLQNTELYTYIHSDIVFIKNQLRDVIKDPRKSKIKTILAGAYLLTPGTFDTTIYILLIKNVTKVTIKKIQRRRGRVPVRQGAS